MEQNNKIIIQEKLRGFDLTFKTTHDLFSYRAIDSGTKLLIENIEVKDGKQCLDLGCGYGPIGITMAKLNPHGDVYMVDRDFIAAEYCKENCRINNVLNTKVLLSDGLSSLSDKHFDTIASNLPTHIAKESLIKVISDIHEHLNRGGGVSMLFAQHD